MRRRRVAIWGHRRGDVSPRPCCADAHLVVHWHFVDNATLALAVTSDKIGEVVDLEAQIRAEVKDAGALRIDAIAKALAQGRPALLP